MKTPVSIFVFGVSTLALLAGCNNLPGGAGSNTGGATDVGGANDSSTTGGATAVGGKPDANSSNSAPDPMGTVSVAATDAANVSVTSFVIDVASIQLTKANGAKASVLPQTTRIDFADARNLSDLLSAAEISKFQIG